MLSDQYWMEQALMLARQAEAKDEVPVGAIVVLNDEIIGAGYNQPIAQHDPTAHAEIVAIRAAGIALNNYRLINTRMYVTLEPCLMCVGAIVHARIERLVFGARDPRTGAVVSQLQVFDQPFLNHRVKCDQGVLAPECSDILSRFFRDKRKKIY